ncbi:MAG: hypothetical protein IIB11_07780 [Chloroflexi bacterium]|nr:hypothetical protein [Chloroflexota bacterium]
MRLEIELTESEAENLLNILLATAEGTASNDLKAATDEARKNMQEQVALAIMLYEKVTAACPKVAESDAVTTFWDEGETRFREFVKS